ncbi:RagB/SusD family nutrient uptake outer membrane protein [Chitinophaga arvensicola]|uniref:SusD family protein n=1 Tax=Chitinophaga arvensicola TaxID=29529 RepID=A0A1I0R458_9BACT|nr:RagB/SusD family nutrient uptake outer membrane protein [Chitinophaga arvensicola]SEW35225.1 SusD family protein [Chitinophaga arvensicola]
MKFKTLPIYALAGLLGFSSCSKLLEEKSQTDIIPKTTTDFRELLMGSGYMPSEEPASMVYYMDDDVDLFLEYDNGNSPIAGTPDARRNFLSYTWQPRQADIDGMGDKVNEDPGSSPYAKFYKWIMGCNAVLDHVDNSIGSQPDKDRVKAEALAVRALYYFRLVNLYGEPYNHNPQALGVPLKLNSSVSAEYMQRETVAKVYETIVADLNKASQLMDPLPIVRKDYHINQPAIHILLSRVYLFMEKWQEAAAEANKVFDQGGVIIDMTNMPSITTGRWLNYNNQEVEWIYGGNAQPNQSTYTPAAAFLSTFDPNDIRLKYGFSMVNGGVMLATKLTIGTDLAQTMRSSEALLNRAEANVQLGKLGDALTDLNTLRRNRIIGYTDVNISDKAILLQAVRDERRKEFCYEAFRWFDLRRYGMPAISHRYQNDVGEAVLQYTLQHNDPAYTLPFPTSLLLRNPQLTQNPSGEGGDRIGQ